MTQFYVVEIKKLPTGDFEHQVYWVYDEDAHIAQLKGESKYHEVMASAATSVATGATIEHSAILFSTEAFPMLHGCYKAN